MMSRWPCQPKAVSSLPIPESTDVSHSQIRFLDLLCGQELGLKLGGEKEGWGEEKPTLKWMAPQLCDRELNTCYMFCHLWLAPAILLR